ncbi:MAG: prepilin-type N-terminal cleavage/methylation domain-containing protein [Patescibacteria group bacterium]
MSRSQKTGFTLAELLIVIAVIGLIMAATVFGVMNQIKKTRDAKRKADIRMIQKALEAYFETNRFYPATSSTWLGTCPAFTGVCGTDGASPCTLSGFTGYVPDLAPNYIAILPKDPKTSPKPQSTDLACRNASAASQCYIYQSDGLSYKVVSYCGQEITPYISTDLFYDPARGSSGVMGCGGAFCDCTNNLSDPANACGW